MATTIGEFEQAVLLAVTRLRDDAYGMTIRQELESRLNRAISIGAVYTTLGRLEEKGFLRSWLGEPTAFRGGRAKRYYAIEPPGLIALERSRQVLDAVWALYPTEGPV